MRTLLIIATTCFLALHCKGQLTSSADQKSAMGSFYVSVDDAARLFLNGTRVFDAGLGQHKSPELELKPGDRLTVHLRNDGGGKHFVLLFAGTNGQSVVSFRNGDFKIVPDPEATDFLPEEFQKWTQKAKDLKGKSPFAVKSYSQPLWGDLDRCTVACIITPKMFSQRPK